MDHLVQVVLADLCCQPDQCLPAVLVDLLVLHHLVGLSGQLVPVIQTVLVNQQIRKVPKALRFPLVLVVLSLQCLLVHPAAQVAQCRQYRQYYLEDQFVQVLLLGLNIRYFLAVLSDRLVRLVLLRPAVQCCLEIQLVLLIQYYLADQLNQSIQVDPMDPHLH